MANRFQKSLETPLDVPSVGTPVGEPDTTTASAIELAGQIASEGILLNKKQGLKKELESLGSEVQAAREGKEIEDASERFKRIKKMQEQGTLDDTNVNILIETELKKAIGKTPAFADELRQLAAQQLNFDPTGSYVQSLFGKSGRTTPTRPLTPLEKDRLEGEALAAAMPGLDAETATQLVGKKRFYDNLAGVLKSKTEIGAASYRDITNQLLLEQDTLITETLATVQAQVAQGGVVKPEELLVAMQQVKQQQLARLNRISAEAGLSPTSTQAQNSRKLLQESWNMVEVMVKEGTMNKILERQASELANNAKIVGFNIYGEAAAMRAAVGGEAVAEYIRRLSTIQSEEQWELISKKSPALAALGNNQQLITKLMNEAYFRVMGVERIVEQTGDFTSPGQGGPGAEDAAERAVVEDIIRNSTDPETRSRLVDFLQSKGQPYKDYSSYAQKGARAKVTDKELSYIKESFALDKPAIIQRISAGLEASRGVELSVQGGRVTLVSSTPTVLGRAQPVGGTGAPPVQRNIIAPSLQADIARLNSMNRLVQNGYARDLEENPNNWIERTVNEINGIQSDTNLAEPEGLDEAIQNFRNNPSEETLEGIRAIDPQLADDILAASTASGGSNGE